MVIVGYLRPGTQRSDRSTKHQTGRPLGRPIFIKMSDKDNERVAGNECGWRSGLRNESIAMSAFGTKRASQCVQPTSAFGDKGVSQA